LIRSSRPHVVFHLASALHTAPLRDLVETNVEGTASLVDAMEPETLLVLGSSASVYGHAPSLPIGESTTCSPVDLYGVTKLAAEHIARVGAARRGFAFVTARIFNVVGPGQSEAHVCARLAAQLATSGCRTLHVGPLDPTRDFIDVRDVAAALLVLADRGERGGTYNVASGRETSIRAVLAELLGICGSEGVAIVARSDHPSGVQRHFADVSRLAALGFRPEYSLKASLGDLAAYYRGLLARNARATGQPGSICAVPT
jgi:GDP-4-dehydro-6-deoxy-D-mannose reductase